MGDTIGQGGGGLRQPALAVPATPLRVDGPSGFNQAQIDRIRLALTCEVFFLAQPDRGDVFSWIDDHADAIAERIAGALAA